MKILITDPIDGVFVEKVKRFSEVEIATSLSPQELLDKVRDCDILVVRSKTKVTKEVIDNAKNLKAIARAGVGVDNIDMKKSLEKNVVVINTADAPSQSVAELTIGLMICLARKIANVNDALKKGIWKKGEMGTELQGKTLGLIGFGNVGQKVAKIAKVFGMEVLVTVRHPEKRRVEIEKIGAKLVDLEELVKESDFVSIHVPLTDETKGMIGEKEMNLMKSNAFIINTSRGGIVDEAALYNALVNKKIAGAGLDVFEKEPPVDNPLVKLDNVVVTPHIAGSTAEAQERIAVTLAEDVIRIIKGEEPKNIVRW